RGTHGSPFDWVQDTLFPSHCHSRPPACCLPLATAPAATKTRWAQCSISALDKGHGEFFRGVRAYAGADRLSGLRRAVSRIRPMPIAGAPKGAEPGQPRSDGLESRDLALGRVEGDPEVHAVAARPPGRGAGA